MRVAVHKAVAKSPAVRPAAAAHTPQLASIRGSSGEPGEREAESTARNVVRMPLPASAATPVDRTDEGRPLAPGVLSFMQAHFRTDLSAVRVHTGAHAAQRNRELNARAFTTG